MSQLPTRQNHGCCQCVRVYAWFRLYQLPIFEMIPNSKAKTISFHRISYLYFNRTERMRKKNSMNTWHTRQIFYRTETTRNRVIESERNRERDRKMRKAPSKNSGYKLGTNTKRINKSGDSNSTRHTISVSQFIFHMFTLLTFNMSCNGDGDGGGCAAWCCCFNEIGRYSRIFPLSIVQTHQQTNHHARYNHCQLPSFWPLSFMWCAHFSVSYFILYVFHMIHFILGGCHLWLSNLIDVQ